MIEVDVEQGSIEWLTMRLGKVTGTRLKNVFKSDNLTLIDELISEIITNEVEETFVNSSMQRGKDLEPIAKSIYEQVKGIEIENVGFCISEEIDILAFSPDGFTKCRTGGIEIKCPNTKTHVKYIRQNKIPSEYLHQIYCAFLINKKLEWMDFISFDDRFNVHPMFVKRVTREEIQTELDQTEKGLKDFEAKFLKLYKVLTN
jgi:hypothetical protein